MKALKKFRAWLFGYFWLPCPICGEMFGGFECGDASVWHSPRCGKIVCRNKDCEEKAHEENIKRFGYTIKPSNNRR